MNEENHCSRPAKLCFSGNRRREVQRKYQKMLDRGIIINKKN